MELHFDAMLRPEGFEEQTLVALYKQLDALCQRYKDDKVMEDSILSLARSIIGFFDVGTGRLDQTTLDQKVRDTVQEAGFNAGTI
jgi:hypothetical protein